MLATLGLPAGTYLSSCPPTQGPREEHQLTASLTSVHTRGMQGEGMGRDSFPQDTALCGGHRALAHLREGGPGPTLPCWCAGAGLWASLAVDGPCLTGLVPLRPTWRATPPGVLPSEPVAAPPSAWCRSQEAEGVLLSPGPAGCLLLSTLSLPRCVLCAAWGSAALTGGAGGGPPCPAPELASCCPEMGRWLMVLASG